jgi:SAM-dependent methyltransferase
LRRVETAPVRVTSATITENCKPRKRPMTDLIATRAEGERLLAAFAPRMGRRHANGRNTDHGPSAHKAVSQLSPYIRRRLVLEADAVATAVAMPYSAAGFDAMVCVDVLEHVTDLHKVLSDVARVLRLGGLFLFDTINRNPLARLATVTIAEDVLRLLPRGTHDPAMFIRPRELRAGLEGAGLMPGPVTGLGPRGGNRRFDLTFGPLPLTAILYMGVARKPALTLRAS